MCEIEGTVSIRSDHLDPLMMELRYHGGKREISLSSGLRCLSGRSLRLNRHVAETGAVLRNF